MATSDSGNQGAGWAVVGLLFVLGGPVMYALLFDSPLMRTTGAPAFALIAAGATAGVVGLRRDRRGWVRVAGGASVIALALAVFTFFVIAALPQKAAFAQLEEALVPGARVVRVMPNTPCQVGCGASGFSLGSAATEADAALVKQLLASVGISLGPLSEKLLDAVTGLSGSGPAYVAMVIEAMADGGVLCGLPRDAAIRFAAQTVLGTARLVLEAGIHPALLKDAVASPGGTTIEAIQTLEECGLRAALIAAVEAATLKAEALGQK